jgi:hypothetical protein
MSMHPSLNKSEDNARLLIDQLLGELKQNLYLKEKKALEAGAWQDPVFLQKYIKNLKKERRTFRSIGMTLLIAHILMVFSLYTSWGTTYKVGILTFMATTLTIYIQFIFNPRFTNLEKKLFLFQILFNLAQNNEKPN